MHTRDQSDGYTSNDISGIDCTDDSHTVEPAKFAEVYVADGGDQPRMRFVADPTEWIESTHTMEVRR